MTDKVNGRKDVALAPGGHPLTETLVSDATTACALPQG
jgi:hypothetical protein